MNALRSLLRRTHRLVGTATAWLVLLWLASGFVMLFVSFPRLSERDRMRGTQELEGEVRIPSAMRRAAARGAFPARARPRLGVIAHVPTWRVIDDEGHVRAYADTPVRRFDAARAAEEASSLHGARARSVTRLREPDQWTVPSSLSARLPLYRVALDDAARTEVYLSEDFGERVQVTTRRTRLFAWLGPIPHWIYPTMLRRTRGAWRTTVLSLTALALVATVSGLVNGLRVRRKLGRRRGRALRDRLLHAHLTLGLWLFLPLAAWLVSGAFSLSPFGRFGGPLPSEALQDALYGRSMVLPSDTELTHAFATCRGGMRVHELELFTFLDRAFVVCRDARARVLVVDAARGMPVRLDERAIVERVRRAFPGARVLCARDVEADDELVYTSHRDEPAPRMIRVDLDDAAQTSVYVDVERATRVAQHTRDTRIDRVLYQGLHLWDPAVLRARPRLRYALIALFLALSAALVLAGWLMASRRARRRWRKSLS